MSFAVSISISLPEIYGSITIISPIGYVLTGINPEMEDLSQEVKEAMEETEKELEEQEFE